MLKMMEAEERRPTPATGKAAQPTLDYDSHHDADGQHQTGAVERQGPLRGCQRGFMPRTTGGSGRSGPARAATYSRWIFATMKRTGAEPLFSTQCERGPYSAKASPG